MPDTTRHPSAGEMSDGSHLSIGEVLALLLEEFPDVTISKIRFLESQGLIDPERTPSGYRKFFDADVELLRVILREQRENYLPLRVIKDRIDSGELETGADEPGVPRGIRNVETEPGTLFADDGSTAAASEAAEDVTEPEGLLDVDVEVVQDEDVKKQATRAAEPATEPEPPSADADAVAAAVRSAGDGAPTPSPSPAAASPQTAPQVLPGVTLSRDELAGMVGASREEVAQLEEYGIISGRESLGERVFDDDAVEVTKVAVEFLRLGVDARHLRGWRTAADRETSVYDQLILPLLRQRNPEGRQAARDQLQRMNELGGKLRSALMRAGLRSHLGG